MQFYNKESGMIYNCVWSTRCSTPTYHVWYKNNFMLDEKVIKKGTEFLSQIQIFS